MTVKAMAATVAAVGEGHRKELNVSALCREAGVSRKVFYYWVNRYKEDGFDGLEERSRRPHSSPNKAPVEVEDRVIELRKKLEGEGLDHGATTIQWHLGKEMTGRVPSKATIHRILVRRGFVIPQPKKRPKSSWRRFEASAPNEWWQIDATDWVCETGPAKIINVLDDHSRVLVRARAVAAATTEEAWVTFSEGAQVWGLPAGTLSDNGLCFSGKLRGFEVFFEQQLRAVGVQPFTGRPYHPQTTGKVERVQQTEKKWLRQQGLAPDLAGLQDQLDEFCRIYNYERPHQGIGRVTPISRWNAGLAVQPSPEPIKQPEFGPRTSHGLVQADGTVLVNRGLKIHLGAEWEGHRTTIVFNNHQASVFIGQQLIRHIQLEQGRSYYGTKRPRGGRPIPRIQS